MTFNEAVRFIYRGDVPGLRHALENGLDPSVKSKLQVPLLSFAASKGNTAIGRLLIERGATVNVRDKWGHTPLADACMKGRQKFVKLLLDSGAELNFDNGSSSVEASLEWVAKNCGVAPGTMRNIRQHFQHAEQACSPKPS